jgi:hypothetical protein
MCTLPNRPPSSILPGLESERRAALRRKPAGVHISHRNQFPQSAVNRLWVNTRHLCKSLSSQSRRIAHSDFTQQSQLCCAQLCALVHADKPVQAVHSVTNPVLLQNCCKKCLINQRCNSVTLVTAKTDRRQCARMCARMCAYMHARIYPLLLFISCYKVNNNNNRAMQVSDI